MHKSAVFDSSRTYRYQLMRTWSPEAAIVAFVMLNPSQADEQEDDPTIRRCLHFAQAWGYGSLMVVNLFAYCTTHPQALKQAQAPIGLENDAYLQAAIEQCDRMILAWGNHGSWQQRDAAVLNLLAPWYPKLYCLGYTQTHHPRHPLYLPRTTSPIPWSMPSAVNIP